MSDLVARIAGEDGWHHYGDVSFYEAARQEAVRASSEVPGFNHQWFVEVRDRDDFRVPGCVCKVATKIVAEVLEPRQEAE
jgi:hypothetical protein